MRPVAAQQAGGMDPRRQLGRYGESIAADLLRRKGYDVLARNWRCAAGELDLIVREPQTLVTIEVKTRRSLTFGSPLEAITPQKAARLRHLTARWLTEHPQGIDAVRIDVVAVFVPATGPAQVRHLRAVA